MNKEKIIKNTENFAKKLLINEGTGHDWWHIVRVRNNSKLINNKEKADQFIIDLAVLLHDVGDRKVIKKEKDDYTIAEGFLKKQKLNDKTIEEVMFIIKNMSYSKTLNTKRSDASKEFMVVQDSDRLDTVGAIGIARTFTYGGSRGQSLYDPNKKARKIKSTKQYQKTEGSIYHHFEEKLLLLKDLMNTKTAKKIAEKRHNFMVIYLKQFINEWEGIK
jgi:uncharacterized protein